MSEIDRSNPWVTLARERRHEDDYIRVDVDRVRHRSGVEHPYTAIRVKFHGVTILPIDDDGNTYLVGQYRYPLDRFLWELPRGSGALDEAPLETARCELAEETACSAEHWLELAALSASPGISSEWASCFFAWGLRSVESAADPHESLSLRRVSFAEAIDSVLADDVVDAPSVALLLGTAERARRGRLPSALVALLRHGGL